MLYLSVPPNAARLPRYAANGIGIMCTPRSWGSRNRPDLMTFWAADNDCFAQGEQFDLAKYLAWLDLMRPLAGRCLFATAPDVLGDAVATWERSALVLPQIRARGYKAALVAQDGMENTTIHWDDFDALFIGGSTGWKLSEAARRICVEAKRRGKWVHMGRVNSQRRIQAAQMWDCDSVDGTLLAFGPDIHLPRLESWLAQARQQPSLWEVA